jgi:putative transposase
MARLSRIVIPNYPHHIIQRGHNRQAVFASEDDYRYYLDNLQEWKEKLGCRLYAYCLMTNHVHLVLDSGRDERNLALLMKRVAGRQTRYVNTLERRSGTLWEGRFKSSPVSTDSYLLACCRYVELNPVRAGLVVDSADYKWSSYAAKVGLTEQVFLDEDPVYIGLADTREERQQKYRQWVMDPVLEAETRKIRTAIQRGQLTGDDRFLEEITSKLGRRLEFRAPGRPRKTEK